jgi:3',5'-cyclic AMP phosphodiesterase CpdA
MRVLHLSDPHLSPGKPANRANADAALPAIRAARPDLIVLTGDLTEDGFVDPGEFGEARAWLDQLPCPAVLLPGNHDVGNLAGVGDPAQRVTAARVEQWCEVLGHDRFAHDAEGWTLLGLNAMLLGSGLSRERDQFDWLTEALRRASRTGRRVAVFLHTPLFLHTPDEAPSPAAAYWCPPPATRDAWWSLLREHGVVLVGSGHCHQNRERRVEGEPVCVWSPAVSGSQVVGDAFPADAFHRPAAPCYEFNPGGWSLEWIDLPLVTRISHA